MRRYGEASKGLQLGSVYIGRYREMLGDIGRCGELSKGLQLGSVGGDEALLVGGGRAGLEHAVER